MIKSIGLVDYDTLIGRNYRGPNYDLGITYADLKQNPNFSVRLITSLRDNNLNKYDKIIIFKTSRFTPHPATYITDYYKRDIEEYGPGFINKDLRPNLKETRYLKPDFTCYNPILRLSADKPTHPFSWKLDKAIKTRAHQQIRLYEEIEGEYLRKDFPKEGHYLTIHDDPLILFNDKKRLATVDYLISQKYHLLFLQPLDISKLNDTNIIERIITDSRLASLRKGFIISELNDKAAFFIDYFLNHKCNTTNVLVLYEKGKTASYYLRFMLDLNYINNKSQYALRLRPYWDKESIMKSSLTHCLYRFLYEKPFLMSFYEYVFRMGCKNLGVPLKLAKTREENYEAILEKYGMDDLIYELENWLLENPEYEEQIFIGGSSKYEKQRKKALDKRRSKYAFGRSPNGIG